MNRITRYEPGAPVFEGDDLDHVAAQEEASQGDHRHYSAEAVFDVLDPYTAIIDGIAVPAAKS